LSWLAAVLVDHRAFLTLLLAVVVLVVICKSLMLTSPLERLP
jgi:hypothetical protein